MANFIKMNQDKSVPRNIARFLGMARESAIGINSTIAVMQTYLSGDGTEESHFTSMVDEGFFPSTTHAKNSYDTMINLQNQFSGLTVAVMTTCAKHGI